MVQIDTSGLRVSVERGWDAGGSGVCGGAPPTWVAESEVSGTLAMTLSVQDLARWLKAYSERELSLEEWLAGEAYDETDPSVYITQVSIDSVRPDFARSVVEVRLTVEDWQVRQ